MIPQNIGKQHIISALDEIRNEGVPKGRESRKYQLIYDKQGFPPKYVISLANKYANGEKLNPSVFNGGAETNSFLEKHGFTVMDLSSPPTGPALSKFVNSIISNADSRALRRDAQKQERGDQKQALKALLKRRFDAVMTEKSFDWLVVPDWTSMDGELRRIAESLAAYRGYREFFSPGIHLQVDYFIPSHNLIIEYDERQHFSIPRSISLSNYPEYLAVGFDKSDWISSCETIKAKDPTPKDRDEQRAFYDSLRDILGNRNGMTVVRVKHGDYDWTANHAATQLEKLFSRPVRKSRPNRIVTICVRGKPATSAQDNRIREALLEKVIHQICSKNWSNLDAILLPGGFFYSDEQITTHSFEERAKIISKKPFHEVCMKGCRELSTYSKGTLIVVGVDSEKDHACVAWSMNGIEGIGRKVFPTDGESTWYVCHEEDYSTSKRIISLPNSRKALLCACYDMFGCHETISNITPRTHNICNIKNENGLHVANPQQSKSERAAFRDLRSNCIVSFQNLLANNEIAIGLAAIHGFKRPGSDNYWQRHGIQTCSAALTSGLAVGAAHFSNTLPDENRSTLCATEISEDYLDIQPKTERKKCELLPKAWFKIDDKLLIRLFEG